MSVKRAKQLESAILGACEPPTPGLYERTKTAVPDITPEEYWSLRDKLYNVGLIERRYDYSLSAKGEAAIAREKGAE